MRSSPRPYFKMLPGWIYESAEYEKLGAAERWLLHLMSGQADDKLDGGSRVGCRMSEDNIVSKCGMSIRTFKRYLPSLEDPGFVVKVGQGGGSRRANEYGIPDSPGALDHKKLFTDERFQTQQTMSDCHGSESANHVNLSTEPCQSVRQTVSDCPPNHVRLTPLYTSSIQRINTSLNTPKASKAVSDPFFPFDDDDKAINPAELPDDASEEVKAKALGKHGVAIRRARTVARKASAESIRNAINLSYQNNPRNRGAYICNLIEGDQEEKLAEYAEEQAEQYRKVEAQLTEADKQIDSMSDDELADLIAAHCERTRVPTEGMTPDFVRRSKTWRKGVTQTLLTISTRATPVTVQTKATAKSYTHGSAKDPGGLPVKLGSTEK